MDDSDLYTQARILGDALIERQHRVAVAESCTGGWVGKVMTGVPGSSRRFDCGFVTYTNRAKQALLGVPDSAFESGGAVSAAVVEAMAAGAVRASDAQWALAISGIAGPDGGTPDKPVGTVWIAWAGPQSLLDSQRFVFDGSRDEVRQASVAAALDGLLQRLA